jgi:Mg2+/Co2+ transporter CorC
VGGFVFGELGRLPKRGDMVQVNGYSLRVESVRENRVEAVRIRDHHARGEEGPAKGNTIVRPIEQAASTPRGAERRASER